MSLALDARSRAPLPAAPSPNRQLVLAVASTVGVLALLLAGITLFALGIAFPIALHVAQTTSIAVSPADVATATRMAGFAPAFIVASVVVFAAAVWLAVASVRRLSPPDAG
jgi:uncharacterized membrane protein